MKKDTFYRSLRNRARWLRVETLKIHRHAPEIRIASCLSAVEVLTVLYYGRILRFRRSQPCWAGRDRLIISKGHGGLSLYPILVDQGFLDRKLMDTICKNGSTLGSIPDCLTPGFETINGSLGHGMGVACGMAVALKRNKSRSRVYVIMGDGELYEGSVWEALMFAAHHKLNNLTLIIDNNKVCMLDRCKNVIDLGSLRKKFESFGFVAREADGHSTQDVYAALCRLRNDKSGAPQVLIANTVKGKGAPSLEKDPLCHIKSLTPEEIDRLIERY